MVINSNRVIWVIGPENCGKSETCEKLYTKLRLLEYNSDLIILDFYNKGNHFEPISNRLAVYKRNKHTPFIRICDGSLFRTLINIDKNPFSVETKEVEQEYLFKYEAHVIPDSFVPTHIVLINGGLKDKSVERWNYYKNEIDLYEKTLKTPLITASFQKKTKLIRLTMDDTDLRVNTIYELIQQ